MTRAYAPDGEEGIRGPASSGGQHRPVLSVSVVAGQGEMASEQIDGSTARVAGEGAVQARPLLAAPTAEGVAANGTLGSPSASAHSPNGGEAAPAAVAAADPPALAGGQAARAASAAASLPTLRRRTLANRGNQTEILDAESSQIEGDQSGPRMSTPLAPTSGFINELKRKIAEAAGAVLISETTKADKDVSDRIAKLYKTVKVLEGETLKLAGEVRSMSAGAHRVHMQNLSNGVASAVMKALVTALSNEKRNEPKPKYWVYDEKETDFERAVANSLSDTLLANENAAAAGGGAKNTGISILESGGDARPRAMCDGRGKAVAVDVSPSKGKQKSPVWSDVHVSQSHGRSFGSNMDAGSLWFDPIQQLLRGGDVMTESSEGAAVWDGSTSHGLPGHDFRGGSSSTGPLFDQYTGSNDGSAPHNKMRRCSPIAFGMFTTGSALPAAGYSGSLPPLPPSLTYEAPPVPALPLHGQFGPSPFDLEIRQVEVGDEVAFIFYEAVQLCDDACQLILLWFRHAVPWMIQMTGEKMKELFHHAVEFRFLTMEAAARCFNEKDMVMMLGLNLSMPFWRRLLSSEVWLNFSIEDPAQREPGYIARLLDSGNPQYSIARTRMLYCPVPLCGNWNVYGFDMRDRVLTVMDPMLTYMGDGDYELKHSATVEIMIRGMAEAGRALGNDGWVINRNEWIVRYNKGWHSPCTREESGSYVLYYAEYFGGSVLMRAINPGDIIRRRKKLVYDVVKMTGNFGDRPGFFFA